MGLDAGHVTGHGLRPAQELKMLGNGVVPQQAALALRMLAGQSGGVAASGALLPTPTSQAAKHAGGLAPTEADLSRSDKSNLWVVIPRLVASTTTPPAVTP
jgi:DNA (cytosine-5)-methyltransferase 1